MREARDDLGRPVVVPPVASRVVSLVPSLTEAIASARPEALVAATDWCIEPADLEVERVRGTKNPDVRRIVALRPDLVLTNKEENRRRDVERLTEAGIPVWVTDIESVPAAVRSLERLFGEALGWERPRWLAEVRRLWSGPLPAITRRVLIPIWRDPWMIVGARTFTGDLVRRCGWHNLGADAEVNPGAERYPQVDGPALDRAGADAVLLPDEPYLFTATDGPEMFARTPVELVSGRLITWYGPSLVAAAGGLGRDPVQLVAVSGLGPVEPLPGVSAGIRPSMVAVSEPSTVERPLRERLVVEAIELTVERGWSGLTMARLADRVGVSRQTVYNELGGKPQLAEAMVMAELAHFLERVDTAFAENPADLVAAVRAAARAVLDLAETNPLLRAVLATRQGAESDLLPLLTTNSAPLLDMARELIRRHVAGYRTGLDEHRLEQLIDMVVRLVLSHVMQPGGPPADIAETIGWIAGRVLAG